MNFITANNDDFILKGHKNFNLLSMIEIFNLEYINIISSHERKKRGQFFTPPSIARFMASLFTEIPNNIKILDPGSGTGILSVSLCERISTLSAPRNIHIELFETDSDIIVFLEKNMNYCSCVLKKFGHQLTYSINQEDFVLSFPPESDQFFLFDGWSQMDNFDMIIMNPPYFKISKDSQHARMMERIIHGQPNIYSLFMALAAKMLKEGGELVAITPRSFCNGLYFREFRRWFFKRMSLHHIHLFKSRSEAFSSAKVLQESVITLTRKQNDSPSSTIVSGGLARDLKNKITFQKLDYQKVIDNSCGNMIIRIPERMEDVQLIEYVERWPYRFNDAPVKSPILYFIGNTVTASII